MPQRPSSSAPHHAPLRWPKRRRRLVVAVGAVALAASWLAGDVRPGPPTGKTALIEHGVVGFGGARVASSSHVAIGYIGFPGAGRSTGGGMTLVGGVTGVSPLSPPASHGVVLR